jgi:hypothetical protein
METHSFRGWEEMPLHSLISLKAGDYSPLAAISDFSGNVPLAKVMEQFVCMQH